jgi:hypothetical protein
MLDENSTLTGGFHDNAVIQIEYSEPEATSVSGAGGIETGLRWNYD